MKRSLSVVAVFSLLVAVVAIADPAEPDPVSSQVPDAVGPESEGDTLLAPCCTGDPPKGYRFFVDFSGKCDESLSEVWLPWQGFDPPCTQEPGSGDAWLLKRRTCAGVPVGKAMCGQFDEVIYPDCDEWNTMYNNGRVVMLACEDILDPCAATFTCEECEAVRKKCDPPVPGT